jgi:hypothetical protein
MLDEDLAVFGERTYGGRLVVLHQAGKAGHIGRENGGELPSSLHFGSGKEMRVRESGAVWLQLWLSALVDASWWWGTQDADPPTDC